MDTTLNRSPLHLVHEARGARFVDFAGWQLPVQFRGILQEHHAVRSAAGLFDISHMGHVRVEGPDAERFLNTTLTNDARKLSPGRGHYSLLLDPSGGILDDLLCYRLEINSFLLVPNASRTAEDCEWLRTHAGGFDVRIDDQSRLWGAMALQGPHSATILQSLLGPNLPLPKRNGLESLTVANGPVLVARTGYTGEDGFEWFCPAQTAALWWDALMQSGETHGLQPCGLGARDTLRLEAGLPLHGSDLSVHHTPLEAGLDAFVKWDKGEFIGKSALEQQREKGIPAFLCGLRMQGKTPPPRAHYTVWSGDRPLGETTSGCLSPTLNQGIALAYLPAGFHREGSAVEIEIRGHRFPAVVASKRALPQT